MPDNPLVNLGELSKPATVLIEKISDAVGGVFKPYQIVRVAKAEAEAEKIRADAEIVVEDIHRRAMHRFFEEEAKKQKNIEDITQKALPNLNDDAKSENVEDDWISNFFDKCRIVSDKEMQNLWANVLAGEANSPGRYSKRTVNYLSSIDKTDASLFTSLCGFVWQVGDIEPLIYNPKDQIYAKHNISFQSLNHLDDIGLIKFNSIMNFTRKGYPKRTFFLYYGNPILVEFPSDEDNTLKIGSAFLSKVGKELVSICGSKPIPSFVEYVFTKWKEQGIVGRLASSTEKENKE